MSPRLNIMTYKNINNMKRNIKKEERENFAKVSSTLFILLSIIMALIITGCTSGTAEKYKIGTDGLKITFAKADPTDVYEGDEFGTGIFVDNLGASSVSSTNPGILKVSYDDYRLQAMSANLKPGASQAIVLHGRDSNYPAGDEAYYEYSFKANPLSRLHESSKTTVNYNLCYPYSTEFTVFMCIDMKNTVDANSAQVCQSTTYTDGGGQGAPIAVTKIEPEMQLQNGYVLPVFNIYIQNLGAGYVTNSTNCQYSDINDNTQMNRVRVSAQLSGDALVCGTVDNNVKLGDSETHVRCKLSDNSADKYSRSGKNFQTPLTITLSYTYTTIEKQELNVLRNSDLEVPVTQGGCASYQIEYQGKCMSKCDYCSGNPTDPICQDGSNGLKIYTKGFNFADFSCECGASQCDTKSLQYGNCINTQGFCPGDTYCCSANIGQCDAYQILFNGKCVDKCDYCSNINPLDTDVCTNTFSIAGFACTKITSTACDNYNKNANGCIRGYCGGSNINMYCTNTTKLKCKDNEIEYDGTCESKCDYCSGNPTDSKCANAMNLNGTKITLNKNYYCGCSANEWNNIGTTLSQEKVVELEDYCTNGDFCCDRTD